MKLRAPLLVSQRVIEKLLSKHDVSPEEVDEVFFDDLPLFRKHSRTYHIYGQTINGRYIFGVFNVTDSDHPNLITAYEMTGTQRNYYRKVKGVC